jgi:hypothetical protein
MAATVLCSSPQMYAMIYLPHYHLLNELQACIQPLDGLDAMTHIQDDAIQWNGTTDQIDHVCDLCVAFRAFCAILARSMCLQSTQ